MAKLLVLLVVFCFVHNSISQSVTCADGLYPTTGNPIADKGQCTTCTPFCKTCNAAMSCLTWIDRLKGFSNGVPICAANAYNPTKDICDNCLEGCAQCQTDYNACTICK